MSQRTPRYQLTYPEATDHTRTWEHWQTLAQDVDLALTTFTKWTYFSASSAISIPANTDYGVGPVTVANGTNAFSNTNDGVTSKLAGILLWSCLFYMPGDTSRQGWGSPPNENAKFYLNNAYAGGADRFSVSGLSVFNAAGVPTFWGWRCSQTINGCTFNVRGVFLPTQPAT